MDHYVSSDGVLDEVDIARQSNRNFHITVHNDAVDSQRDDSVGGRQSQEETLPASPDNVLPNPGVSRDDEEYFMGNRERGVALIFNHEEFDIRQYSDRNRPPPKRKATNVDRDALRDAFKSLGFEVLCFDDQYHYQICNELRRVAEQNHSNRDCVAVAVLSHGGRNGMLYARDREYYINELWEPFTARQCPTLAGKPKLFFIQACKGNIGDPGVTVSDVGTDAADDGRGEEVTYPVPSYADFLVSYATFEGLYSFRNEKNGSWYVQTLCSHLKDHGRTKDLVSLLTGVNRIVGQRFRSQNKEKAEVHGKVQAPCFTSSLTRRLCFGQNSRPCRQSSSPDSCPKRPRRNSFTVRLEITHNS